MKNFLCSFLLFTQALLGQSGSVRAWGREWVVLGEAVYTRSEAQPQFLQAKGIPLLPASKAPGMIDRTFDGDRLYQAEFLTAKLFSVRCAEVISQQEGPVWYWHPPIQFKDEAPHLLAASAGRFLLGVRVAKDGTSPPVFRVDVVEWPSQNRRTLLELQDAHRNLRAVAIAVDGEFFLFLTNGSLYRIDPAAGSPTNLECDLFRRLTPRFTESVSSSPKSPDQPPSFLSPPFCSTSGEIFVPAMVRQLNRYSENFARNLFASLPAEEQRRLVEVGRWPLKPQDYEGSEYVALMLRFDPASRTLSSVPPKTLGNLVREMPETEQWLWAEGRLPPLTVDVSGKFLALGSVPLLEKEGPALIKAVVP